MNSAAPILLSFSLLACAGGQDARSAAPSPLPEESGALPEVSQFACNFAWQQSVSAKFGPMESTFDAIVECEGGELKMLGLTPFKTRAFLLTQRGTTFQFEKFIDRELPFSPKQLLVDLHRAFFIGFELNPSERSAHYFGEERRDELHDGKVFLRTLTRAENPGKSVRIRYEGGFDGHTPPAKITLENGYYGYSIEVLTLSSP